MSLTIKSTEEKSIKIAGTEFTLESVYGRLEFAARANGLTLEIATATYVSKETYLPTFEVKLIICQHVK